MVGLPVLVLARWRALGRLEASAPVPEREYQLLRGVGMFAPLPVAQLEEIARHLSLVVLPAGAEIIHEGDAGDRFYVIADGEVAVSQAGRFRRTEAEGDCFGEIALLNDTPRTATVTASSDVSLYTLGREQFLTAITGMADVHGAARTLASERLAQQAAEQAGD